MSLAAWVATYAVQLAAAVTATAATGVFYEAHRMRRSLADNTQRSERNKRRSIGTRRWIQQFGARLVGSERYQPPHALEPSPTRVDGGDDDA